VPLGGVPQSGASGEASDLIGGLAEQFSTEFRERLQRQEEWQSRDEGLTTAKKRRTDLEPKISFEEDVFLQKVENAMANACRGFVMPAVTAGSVGDIQSLRTEMKEDIARVQIHLTKVLGSAMEQMQAETDKRTAAMLEGLMEQVRDVLKQTNNDGIAATQAHVTSEKAASSLHNEIGEDIARVQAQLAGILNAAMVKMQTESAKRAEAMLEGLERKLHDASEQAKRSAASTAGAHETPTTGSGVNQKLDSQPAQGAQRTWESVTRTATPAAAGWQTMTNGEKKLKKHPLDQRRILLVRNKQSHHCDPRDIMFAVNKALAHARADVTVRLIKMKYTEKGNLSCVLSEHACAEELLRYALAVMDAVQDLDPAVIDVEKTERWRKLRVHGVDLDRYMTEEGLDLVREVTEVMTDSQLPYAPRWIERDDLAERFDSGAIKRSTLVLTVKTKRAADTILVKGLSFGGRRHEAERFWERGEGRMCMQCCGGDHFGKCAEETNCYICAGEHEGAKHQCAVEGCNKKAEPCEHLMVKCANCRGPHVATSRKCSERVSSRQKRTNHLHNMRSSPPLMNTESRKKKYAGKKRQEETQTPLLDLEQNRPLRPISVSSDISMDGSLPEA
jgi:DNA-binding ferritin-like protein